MVAESNRLDRRGPGPFASSWSSGENPSEAGRIDREQRSWDMDRSTASEEVVVAPDAVAFELFFERERRRLFRALYVMTGSAHEAEELAQDAFCKIWERWDRVAEMDDPVGYLYRAAMNLGRSRYRRIIRAARAPLSSEQVLEPYGPADSRDAVVRAVAQLSARQRQAIVLVELLDRSTDEAAELMHVSVSTVRSLTSEARKAMRTAMEPNDE
jgi:RNA polymerase sigma-70 factor (ECF subfamily)